MGDKLRALSRTYAPTLAGTPVAMQFDPKTSAFRLIYSTAESAATRLLPSVIYLNEELRYGNGHDVHVINGSKLPWPLSRKNQIALTTPLFAPSGTRVDVAVAPKYDGARVGVRWLNREPAVTWEVIDTARPGFSLLVLGKEAQKEVRVFGDDGDQLCLLEASSAGLKHCALDQTDWHGLLFGYRIELWFN